MSLYSRVPRKLTKVITFTGLENAGLVGTFPIFTVPFGAVLLNWFGAECLTTLVGDSATIEVGIAANTAALIAQETATDIDAGGFYVSATQGTLVSAVVDKLVSTDIIGTVATADITAGVLRFTAYWMRWSDDGMLST